MEPNDLPIPMVDHVCSPNMEPWAYHRDWVATPRIQMHPVGSNGASKVIIDDVCAGARIGDAVKHRYFSRRQCMAKAAGADKRRGDGQSRESARSAVWKWWSSALLDGFTKLG